MDHGFGIELEGPSEDGNREETMLKVRTGPLISDPVPSFVVVVIVTISVFFRVLLSHYESCLTPRSKGFLAGASLLQAWNISDQSVNLLALLAHLRQEKGQDHHLGDFGCSRGLGDWFLYSKHLSVPSVRSDMEASIAKG